MTSQVEALESPHTPEEIWQTLADPASWSAWLPDAETVELDGPLMVGTYGLVQDSQSHRAQFEIEELVPLRKLTLKIAFGLLNWKITFEITPSGGGGSAIRVVTRQGVVSGLLGFKQRKNIVGGLAQYTAIRAYEPPCTLEALEDTGSVVLRSVHLGEVSRHFDSQINTSIDAYLSHRLGFEGWSAGITVGRMSVGVGRLGLTGESTLDGSIRGTARDNLTGDGFLAVFEVRRSDGLPDTYRLVVPSEPEIQAFLTTSLRELAGAMARDSAAASAYLAAAKSVASYVSLDVTYAADRLAAILRLPGNQRPTFSVAGLPLNEHALLGTGIQIGSDEKIWQLFPAMFLRLLATTIDRSPRPQPTGTARVRGENTCSGCGKWQLDWRGRYKSGDPNLCWNCGRRLVRGFI